MTSYTQRQNWNIKTNKDPVKLDPRILERKSIFGFSATASCAQDNLVIEYGLSGFHIYKSQI